jgi:outer membrane biogenesis lipoprotein LolB
VLTALLLAGACAGKRLQLPADPGTPLSDYADIHRQLAAGCADVRTFRTALSLSGTANGDRLGGTLAAGFRAPDAMRLELRVRPLGTLAFVLVADARGATLLLPRDKQVVRSARGEDLLSALTGIALAPADLMAILTGCVVPSPHPTGGRRYAKGWISIDLADAATVYAQQRGTRWQVRAAQRGEWRIEYPEWPATNRFPTRVALTATQPVVVDVRATLSNAEANVDLGDFAVAVPAGTETIPLDDLRRSGPLRSP